MSASETELALFVAVLKDGKGVVVSPCNWRLCVSQPHMSVRPADRMEPAWRQHEMLTGKRFQEI